MYRVMLGINPDINHPAYKHIIIHPQPGGSIQWAKGSYESINGRISVDWKKEANAFVLNVEIPVNATSTLILPKGTVKMNGKPATATRTVNGEQAVELGSGIYNIIVN
jgi:alpha-L-rhamnosidase